MSCSLRHLAAIAKIYPSFTLPNADRLLPVINPADTMNVVLLDCGLTLAGRESHPQPFLCPVAHRAATGRVSSALAAPPSHAVTRPGHGWEEQQSRNGINMRLPLTLHRLAV